MHWFFAFSDDLSAPDTISRIKRKGVKETNLNAKPGSLSSLNLKINTPKNRLINRETNTNR